MKLYFHVDKLPINGYNNVNLATDSLNLNNLDSICERSEATEIILDEILGYINYNQIQPLLLQFITRLRFRGKIIIQDTDITQSLNMYHNGLISLSDLNSILYGTGKIRKCSCFSMLDIDKIVVEGRLQIESFEINSSKFILIAKRTL